MNKLLVICGPTATGKTELALELAKKFNGELISADSRQVYKGMDVGTGKDLPQNEKLKIKNEKLQLKMKNYLILPYVISGINLWLYDVIEPNQRFSVADYYQLAWVVIRDIWERGKLPILVGGTGLYIKAVATGINTLGILPDYRLRKELELKNTAQLQEILRKANPTKFNSMNNSDRNNPRRLIRAIEISIKKQVLSIKNNQKKDINSLFIGLTAPRKILYQKIDKRVEKRVKQGIIKEIRGLLAKGYSWDLPSMSGLGYKQWKEYFQGQESEDQAIRKWKFAEHNFARRQLTWFKKDRQVIWYDITDSDYYDKIVAEISSWYL